MRTIHAIVIERDEWLKINDGVKTYIVSHDNKIRKRDLIQFYANGNEVNELYLVKDVEYLQLEQIAIISIKKVEEN